MEVKREVVFLKESESSDPVWVSEVVIVRHGIIRVCFVQV